MYASIALSDILPSAAADLQDLPESGSDTADAIPVRLRARCVSRPTSATRPGSTRGFSLRRSSVIGKIANVMPLMPGKKAQVLLARVSQEKESLVCYRHPSTSSLSKARSPVTAREWSDSEVEVMLRVPLCLALVSRDSDTSVSVTMPAQDLWEKLRGLRKPACELFSALTGQPRSDQTDAPQSWTLECTSPKAASLLFERLQMAGCIVQGLQRRYQMMEVIGYGNFGVVLRAEDLHTGAIVAIKVFTKDYDQKLMHPLLEATILRSYRHENIQAFLGVYKVTEGEILDRLEVEPSHTYAIVSEFLAGGELLTYLERSKKLTEDHARNLAKQLLSAIARLHEGSIVHRDIKLENLILTGLGSKVKLIDFGLSALDSDYEAMSMKAGSPGYAAPEILTEPQTCKADCFSCGVILYILLTGETPFPGRDANEILVKNMRCQVDVSPLAKVSEEAKDVVMGLLRKKPCERLSAAAALGHAWFTQPAPLAAPVAPAAPRTRPATPRARHLPGLKMPQPFIIRRPPETHRAAALTGGPDATPAVELDLGQRLPYEVGVRRRDTSLDRDSKPTLLSPTAAPRATGASAAKALASTSSAAAQGPTSSTATAAAAMPLGSDRVSGAPSAAAASAHAWPGPRVEDPGASVASLFTAKIAPRLPDGDTDDPPQRDTSPAPAVDRFTVHHGRRHEKSSADACGVGDVVRHSSSARPVRAWCEQVVSDRPGLLECPGFVDRAGRPSFHSEASPSLHVKRVLRLPRPADTPHARARALEKPGALLADPERVEIRAGLARARLPSPPPPTRCRRPAGLQQHRHRNLQRS